MLPVSLSPPRSVNLVSSSTGSCGSISSRASSVSLSDSEDDDFLISPSHSPNRYTFEKIVRIFAKICLASLAMLVAVCICMSVPLGQSAVLIAALMFVCFAIILLASRNRLKEEEEDIKQAVYDLHASHAERQASLNYAPGPEFIEDISALHKARAEARKHEEIRSQEIKLFSRVCGDDVVQILADVIESAKEEIVIRGYRLNSHSLILSIIEKVEAGVKVIIYYERISEDLLEYENENLILIACPKVDRQLMHRKSIVVDNRWVWLGTANYSDHSLIEDKNMVIGVDNPELSQFVKNEESGSVVISGQRVQFFTLPDQGLALFSVLKLLRSARYSIKIAMFYMSNKLVLREIIRAKQKGIKVDIYLDYGTLRQTMWLVNQMGAGNLGGVHFFNKRGRTVLHAKLAIIDQKTLVIGSVNWSEAGFSLNYENMLIIEDLTFAQMQQLNLFWNRVGRQCVLLEENKFHELMDISSPLSEI